MATRQMKRATQRPPSIFSLVCRSVVDRITNVDAWNALAVLGEVVLDQAWQVGAVNSVCFSFRAALALSAEVVQSERTVVTGAARSKLNTVDEDFIPLIEVFLERSRSSPRFSTLLNV